MALIRRQINGPQDFHEQSDGIAFRDTRRLGLRVAEFLSTGFSAAGLASLGVLTIVAPGATTLTVPLALIYASYVMTRPVRLPLRLPANAGRKDYNNPVPARPGSSQRKPGPPMGDYFLGWEDTTGQQLWLSGREDMTMHGVLPGATGSGKTAFIYSLLCNTLAHGSGFMLVDGKSSNNLAFTVSRMARHYGRDADVRVINMLVSSGDRKTHTWNPFSSINAEGMTELLLTLFLPDENGGGGSSDFFRKRADALIRGMAHVFVWVRDQLGIPIVSETIRAMFSEIEALRDLVERRRFRFYNFETDGFDSVDLPKAFPKNLLSPVEFYVRETGGFTSTASLADQAKVREQHSYVVGGFAKTFTQMGSSLRHIFHCTVPDVDFHDVLFNRRLLVVMLPSLENHPDTNAALGNAVITARRYAMSAALGSSIEGKYGDLVTHRPSAAHTPYVSVDDETGYYVSRGQDIQMAQGRELNISLLLSFQEVGSIYAALGRDRSVPLLGNPKLKIIQNLEDAGPTKEWVESMGGTMQVSMLPGYDTSSAVGMVRDQQRADIRDVKRVDWNDIQRLERGQGIILFRGRRIYASLVYAGFDIASDGYNRLLPTLAPRLSQLEATAINDAADLSVVESALRAGKDLVGSEPLSPLGPDLMPLYEKLSGLAEVTLDPLTLADELFGRQAVGENAPPFATLFANLPRPAKGAPTAAVTTTDKAVMEMAKSLAAIDIKFGYPEVEATSRLASLISRRNTARTALGSM